MNLLTVTNLSAGYAGKQVIKDISFFVAPKTIVGILGANGCGKTTLIKAIANLLPHTGSCQLDDTYLENASPRQLALLCGYIPQKSGISIDLTLLDVVLMGFNPKLSLLQSPTEQMKKEAFDALCSVGLGSRKDDNFQHLSEGQKQLCLLARTFVLKRRLLLLDEPESALDFRLRYETMGRRTGNAARSFSRPQLLRYASGAFRLRSVGRASSLFYPDFQNGTASFLHLWYNQFNNTFHPPRRETADHDKGGRCLLKAVTRITFCDDNDEKFFGEGPCRLLHAIEETGSLRSAAISMGLAYTKALRIIKNAEAALGFPLTTRCVGGKSGGGSTLTPQGKEWLTKYETYRDACVHANRKLYLEIFSDKR